MGMTSPAMPSQLAYPMLATNGSVWTAQAYGGGKAADTPRDHSIDNCLHRYATANWGEYTR
jgi:hypothetical protein